MPVVQEAVQHRADRGRIIQQFAPVLDGTGGGQQSAGPLVASPNDLQQIFGSDQGQLAHTEVIDDEQRHRNQ